MSKELKQELLELSKKVDKFFEISAISSVENSIELSSDVEIPYQFTCEALHPGIYKGFTIDEQEIYKAKDTIFESEDNYHNYEINKDHKNSRKEGSSVSDLVGKVLKATYDFNKQAYIITGEVYNKELALKIANKLLKYVSLRIIPGQVDYKNGQKYAKDLKFQEMSFVRVPGDERVKIY